jgi:hypothetical protein
MLSFDMPSRSPQRHRDEAKNLRERADDLVGDPYLRERYLALAREYDRLADALERRHPSSG